jgi:hypothetical protein
VETNVRALEHQILERRRRLDRNLNALEQEARSLVDWKIHYRRHPGPALAAAATAGMVLAAVTRSRRGPRQSSRPFSLGSRSLGSRLRAFDPENRAGRAVDETWHRLLDTFIKLASAKAVALISDAVPGFEEEYARTHK